MSWLGVVWICLVLYALAMLIFSVALLFTRGKRVFQALRGIDFPVSQPPETKSSPYVPAPTGNVETLTEARIVLHTIKQQRRLNKIRRMRRALKRWAGYGLVNLPR